MVAMSQELRHSTHKSLWMTGDYLGTEVPLSQVMSTWPFYIYRFELQYDKAFAGDFIFGSDIVDIIHNRVKVFTTII